ncbi:MAG TPA: glycosyltransferase family 4 protein [Tepidisphaeraceae bacterium]|jgi:glycosyltransferase involved in cell wall biosynthesis|nr:glycosyltransferase family 4 protein [Tepidisphaeraceae bacterium]
MRICLYTSTALPKLGGQEAVVDALAREFLAAGHEPVVLAPQPRRPVRTEDDRLPYPVVRHPRFYSTRAFVRWYRWYLLRLYATRPFDILHCHDVYPTGWIAALCRKKVPVPVVITSHGGDVKPGNIRISKPGMRPRYVRAIRNSDCLISIGQFTEEGYRLLEPNGPRIVPIPNGIDLHFFAAKADRPAELDPRIVPGQYALFLGRLKKRKGVPVLLEAFASLPPASRGNVELVIAGSGEEQSAIEQLSSGLALGGRVHLAGRVEGQTKLYLLQNARCVVMPSQEWEAFPLVLMESFAAGRPVIGSRIPGIRELIADGQTGLLVSESNPAELAAAIARLLADPAEADAIGARAAAVAKGFGWDAVAGKHLTLYAELRDNRVNG